MADEKSSQAQAGQDQTAAIMRLRQQPFPGQHDPGKPGHGPKFGQGRAHVDVDEMVGRIGVEQAGYQPGAVAPPAPRQHEHARRAQKKARQEGGLDRGRESQAQQQMKGFGHVVSEGSIDHPQGITVAHGMVRPPARPPGAIANRGVKFNQVEDAVMGVVRAEEVAGRQERGPGWRRQDQQPSQPGQAGAGR